MSKYNEATRVQMPAMVHLTRLGYSYYGKLKDSDAGVKYDPKTNILLKVFREQFQRLNPRYKNEFDSTLSDIQKKLNDNDLGRGFYNLLTTVSPIRLIDFDNPANNTFHFTAEFTCRNGEEEFRPDITLFVNGLPLCFIEVKKPNNKNGIVAESGRMNKKRFTNKKFRRFINITQLMIFSNNMEYDTLGGIVPIEGAFYCTGAREQAYFNCFREENPRKEEIAPFHKEYPYKSIDPKVERQILTDFNCQVIIHSDEYKLNLGVNRPTNRIITSMCSPERFLYILRYGIAFVRSQREVDGKIESRDEKHIMRYQQLFASLAVQDKLSEGVRSGIIWHTQGSGKTALSFYLTYILTDYFAKRNKVAKFYFIVDRLDLLEQAKQEFEARGLKVVTANTRDELMKQFKTHHSQEGTSGKTEITVVNIQRFAEEKSKVELEYATNLQRIFIMDEAHRSYRPGGSFLANLFDADKDSIKIALTGTPLLKNERASWKVFGDYIHTYYYDRSIEDGYTLKIIREDIETSYKEKLNQIYNKLETLVEKKQIRKNQIVEHDSYVDELLRYILNDLVRFRKIQGDHTLGGMIICETSNQAEKIFAHFDKIKQEIDYENDLRAGLILHDYKDKETRKQMVTDFKKNMTIDILIVYNMLLTGFDAPRLKRLYFGRSLKDHNLLQAITRVNRPYKDMRYGYLIDFADIKRSFDETNAAYLQELNRFNDVEETGEGNNTDTYLQIIEDKEEILRQMHDIEQMLFYYSCDNLEKFSREISDIDDKTTLVELKNALIAAKDLANMVRTFADEKMREDFAKIEITEVSEMLSEVQRRIDIINQKNAIMASHETTLLVNEAMLDIEFNFKKIGEEELHLIDGGIPLKEKKDKAITLASSIQNLDPEDPEFITLRDAFFAIFEKKGFEVDSMEQYDEQTKALDKVIAQLKQLEKVNNVLMDKYGGDLKFVRTHKRIVEKNKENKRQKKPSLFNNEENKLKEILQAIKNEIDEKIYKKKDILKNDGYFRRTVMQSISVYIDKYADSKVTAEYSNYLRDYISQQYLDQYETTYRYQRR